MIADTLALLRVDCRVRWLSDMSDPKWAALLGQPLWSLVVAADIDQCRADIGAAITGATIGVRSYRANEKPVGDREPRVSFHLWRLPSSKYPLLAAIRMIDAVVAALSPRECDIARLITQGSSKEIANRLRLSPSTIETMRQRLSAKLNMSGHSLISWCAVNADLIGPGHSKPKREAAGRREDDPTPDEIAERCAILRKGANGSH